jgi:hypothetical protein
MGARVPSSRGLAYVTPETCGRLRGWRKAPIGFQETTGIFRDGGAARLAEHLGSPDHNPGGGESQPGPKQVSRHTSHEPGRR